MILVFKDADGRGIVTPDWTVEENNMKMIVISYLVVINNVRVYRQTTIELSMDKFIKDMHWAIKHCNGVYQITPY